MKAKNDIELPPARVTHACRKDTVDVPIWTVVGDIDGDGVPELVLVGQRISVFKRTPGGL